MSSRVGQKKASKGEESFGLRLLDDLVSTEPLDARANFLRTRMEAKPEEKPLLALSYAANAAFLGDAMEAEFSLRFARESSDSDATPWIDLFTAFVALRLGDFTRALAALRRTEGNLAGHSTQLFAQFLYAQALLREEGSDAAFIMAQRALTDLSAEEKKSNLGAFAALVHAEVALTEGAVEDAIEMLADTHALGLLGASMDFLRGRAACESASPDFSAARAHFSKAAWGFSNLNAPRELGLVYIAMARVEAGERVEFGAEPVQWLARAHALLTKAGTPQDLEALQRAFRTYGRRALDRLVDGELASRIDRLRSSRSRLRDIVAAHRDARQAVRSADGVLQAEFNVDDHELDEAMLELREASEQVVTTLEDMLVERERTEQLALAAAALADAADVTGLYHELVRVAVRVCPSNVASVIVREGSEKLKEVASVGLTMPLDGPNATRIGRAIDRAYERGEGVYIDEPLLKSSGGNKASGKVTHLGAEAKGRACVVPLVWNGPLTVLFVAKTQGGGRISERDVERLTNLTRVASRIRDLLMRPVPA